MPEVFELNNGLDGQEKAPAMIPSALLGSRNDIGSCWRYGGALPLDCSLQVQIIPISEKFMDYANVVRLQCIAAGCGPSGRPAEKMGF